MRSINKLQRTKLWNKSLMWSEECAVRPFKLRDKHSLASFQTVARVDIKIYVSCVLRLSASYIPEDLNLQMFSLLNIPCGFYIQFQFYITGQAIYRSRTSTTALFGFTIRETVLSVIVKK
jgi:hypothetical protein